MGRFMLSKAGLSCRQHSASPLVSAASAGCGGQQASIHSNAGTVSGAHEALRPLSCSPTWVHATSATSA
eukprot:380896-Rhodomonas_salina.6